MTPRSFPVHNPRAGWRNTFGRRFLLLLGWLGVAASVASLFAASHMGALWMWGVGPASAGFAAMTQLILPEPRPVAPARPVPKYAVADQRLNLMPAAPAPEPVAQVVDPYRARLPHALPQRQAA